MKLISSFTTAQCDIIILDTELTFEDLKIYCIKSYHRYKQEVNVRFGNKLQIEGMVNSYHLNKRFAL